MKYKVDWSSPRQGIQSTMVDALNMTAAKEQVDSMYAHIDGFKVFCVSPVFEKEKTYQSYEQQPIKVQLVESSDVGSDDDISATIAAGFIIVGGILILLGMYLNIMVDQLCVNLHHQLCVHQSEDTVDLHLKLYQSEDFRDTEDR